MSFSPSLSIITILLLMLQSGCTHIQLRQSSVQLASTVSDMHDQQVLRNVAMFYQKRRNAIPSFAVVGNGTAQVSDTGTAGPTAGWDPFGLTSVVLGLTASRNIQENWTLNTVNDPDKLEIMRCAFRRLFDGPEMPCNNCSFKLQEYFGSNIDCKLPTGWFECGPRKCVPKDACYVGCYCDTYAWVIPGCEDEFNRFTLSMIEIGSTAMPWSTASVQRTYTMGNDPFDPNSKASSTQVTTTERIQEPTAQAPSPAPAPGEAGKSEQQRLRERAVRPKADFQDGGLRGLLNLKH